jgi:hypothetical protein
MPGPRLPMRKIRDVLRLSAAGMSKRKIAASLGVSATAARDCIGRAQRAGLTWPLPESLTDEALELRLYPPPIGPAKDSRPQPDWAAMHRELRRPGVTLQLLCPPISRSSARGCLTPVSRETPETAGPGRPRDGRGSACSDDLRGRHRASPHLAVGSAASVQFPIYFSKIEEPIERRRSTRAQAAARPRAQCHLCGSQRRRVQARL